jgi:hypothetical protein
MNPNFSPFLMFFMSITGMTSMQLLELLWTEYASFMCQSTSMILWGGEAFRRQLGHEIEPL